MKRINRIYFYIVNNSVNLTKSDILEGRGFTAQSIGEKLNVLRNNVSKELNTLSREGKLIKVSSKETPPLEYLIDHDTSLKNQIDQAKAALIYPPNGLHTLIIGKTGVGKRLLYWSR